MRTAHLSIPTLLLTLACGGATRSNAVVEIIPTQEAEHIGTSIHLEQTDVEQNEALQRDVQSADINSDGIEDLFLIYQTEELERVLVRREVDLNWDGLVDVRTWLDPTGALLYEEMDGDFDGWVDWVDYYEEGQRVRSEIDTDYDHNLDLILFFENGNEVVRRMRDSNFDGLLNRVESATCIEIDEGGDGIHELRIPALQGGECPEL